jgi:hypothetical protein
MVDSQVSQHPWAAGRFYLNPSGPSFLGYHKGQKWNGFAVPFFKYQDAKKVVASVVDSGESYAGHYFNKEADQFTLIPHNVPCYAGEQTKGEDIFVDGNTIHVYGIGAGGWTWNVGPAFCENCTGIYLTEDFQCPECKVSHTGACGDCGRFGYHRDGCSESDEFVARLDKEEKDKESKNDVAELAATFERAYQYYNGWGFAYEYPGVFTYYQLGGDLTLYFTPDWGDKGKVGVQVQTVEGDDFDAEGGDHDFKTDRSAPALFRIVKPYLDRLAGKSTADVKGGAQC